MIIKQSNLWFIFAFILISGLLLATLPASVTEASANLPNRSTPTPVRPSDSGGGDDKDGGPVGAYIELQVQNASAEAWSIMQWQDSAGGWHDVEGWQGTLDNGHRRWWVAFKDFGTGPFRWVVYRSPGGPVMGSSVPFNLPVEANQTMQIEVLVK